MWYESAFLTWPVIVALIIGGAVHVYPKLLGKLAQLPVLNNKNVRYVQVIVGLIILAHVVLMIWY